MQEQKLLFEDKDVRITNKDISIKCYFFPFGNAKTIRYEDIIKVELRSLQMAKLRIWGMSAFNWGYWFPGDCSRPQRQQFLAIYLDSCIVPTLTCANINLVHQIIMSQLEKHRHQPNNNNNQNNVIIHHQDSLQRNFMRE